MSCSRRWPALPSHATAPRSASCSPRCRRRKHVDVRCPARQRCAGTSPSPTRSGPPALIRRSAATGLSRSRATRAAYPCRTLTGISRLWISSTRTAPSYIYALYMLMLEHVSSIGDRFRGGGLFVLSPPNFFFLPEHHVLVPAPLHVAVRALCCPAVCAVMTDDGRRRQRVQRHRDECRLALLSFQCYRSDGLVC